MTDMKEQKQGEKLSSTDRRLDALLRFLIEMKRSDEPFTDKRAAILLNSVGLGATDIARILGKKSATDISQYLYTNKKIKKNKRK